MDVLRPTETVAIPETELDIGFSRAGGPGGQRVNTSATKVELRFDVDGSPSLTDEQRAQLHAALGNRITGEGVLILQASEHRSQTRNRDAVVARFEHLVGEALRPPRPRRRTRRPRAADERRLEEKRRQSEKKAARRPPQT